MFIQPGMVSVTVHCLFAGKSHVELVDIEVVLWRKVFFFYISDLDREERADKGTILVIGL